MNKVFQIIILRSLYKSVLVAGKEGGMLPEDDFFSLVLVLLCTYMLEEIG